MNKLHRFSFYCWKVDKGTETLNDNSTWKDELSSQCMIFADSNTQLEDGIYSDHAQTLRTFRFHSPVYSLIFAICFVTLIRGRRGRREREQQRTHASLISFSSQFKIREYWAKSAHQKIFAISGNIHKQWVYSEEWKWENTITMICQIIFNWKAPGVLQLWICRKPIFTIMLQSLKVIQSAVVMVDLFHLTVTFKVQTAGHSLMFSSAGSRVSRLKRLHWRHRLSLSVCIYVPRCGASELQGVV